MIYNEYFKNLAPNTLDLSMNRDLSTLTITELNDIKSLGSKDDLSWQSSNKGYKVIQEP